MTISEAEEYVSENYEEEYILEEDDNHCIILNAPGYSITGYNIVCYDGYWFDKIEDQADFSLTAIFKDGEFDYWEQDCMAVTLHNYFTEQGIDIDVYSLQCEIKEGFIMKGGD